MCVFVLFCIYSVDSYYERVLLNGNVGKSCVFVWACICKSLCTNIHMWCWLTAGDGDTFFLPAHPVILADRTASWWNKLNSLLPNVNTEWHYANTRSDSSLKTYSMYISCVKKKEEKNGSAGLSCHHSTEVIDV